MNRRTFIASVLLAPLAPSVLALAPPVDKTYADKFVILSPEDIREHFHYAPKPVFKLNGQIYVVKTRFAKEIITHDKLMRGNWRDDVIPRAIRYIERDQEFFQRAWPGSVLWVHSFKFCSSYLMDPDNRMVYPSIWRSVVVKPGDDLQRQLSADDSFAASWAALAGHHASPASASPTR